MPNPVAVNDLTPISGSLQTSRISYGVETAGKNYGQNYNGTTWYSDIPNGGEFYTIISDNYTANYYISRSNAEGAYVEGGLPAVDEYSAPVFWTTVGTSSLDVITIVNGLPDRVGQIPFNSGSQALNWIASSSNYFAVGPDYYAQIDADNLQLYLDANQIISYPTTMSTWYDLSGDGINGTLTNGPTWNSNGWFDFDGTDDYVDTFNTFQFSQSGQFSVCGMINIKDHSSRASAAAGIIGKGHYYSNSWDIWLSNTNVIYFETSGDSSPSNVQYLNSDPLTIGRWYFFAATYNNTSKNLWVNSSQYSNTYTGTGGFTNNNTVLIARRSGDASRSLIGSGSTFSIYDKTLTAAEVAQNYYGGPIVTNNLVFAIDAGNLVSYPKSGTTAYDLTGSNNGTLTNGTGFSSEDGGTWTFDGVDDGINIGTLTPTGGATFEAWINITSGNSNYGAIFTNWGSSADAFFIGTFPSSNYIQVYFNGSLIFEVLNLPFNTWILLTVTNNGSNVSAYVNGILTNTASGALVSATGITSIGYDINRTNYPFKGNISNAKIYNRALTADEVLQNYNATK
jgi:hypothetical protein